MNPNCLLFSEREREGESPKFSREGGGAMVLDKFSVPGCPTNLDNSRTRAYWACSRCEWSLFGHFFLSSIFSLFFLSLPFWDTGRYRLKYCQKGPLHPKQPTNQIQSSPAYSCYHVYYKVSDKMGVELETLI